VVDDDHAGVWTATERPGDIRIDRIAFVALHADGFSNHAFILVGLIHFFSSFSFDLEMD
jgi:hypothetical protein